MLLPISGWHHHCDTRWEALCVFLSEGFSFDDSSVLYLLKLLSVSTELTGKKRYGTATSATLGNLLRTPSQKPRRSRSAGGFSFLTHCWYTSRCSLSSAEGWARGLQPVRSARFASPWQGLVLGQTPWVAYTPPWLDGHPSVWRTCWRLDGKLHGDCPESPSSPSCQAAQGCCQCWCRNRIHLLPIPLPR